MLVSCMSLQKEGVWRRWEKGREWEFVLIFKKKSSELKTEASLLRFERYPNYEYKRLMLGLV